MKKYLTMALIVYVLIIAILILNLTWYVVKPDPKMQMWFDGKHYTNLANK